jgi:hypothetical protein
MAARGVLVSTANSPDDGASCGAGVIDVVALRPIASPSSEGMKEIEGDDSPAAFRHGSGHRALIVQRHGRTLPVPVRHFGGYGELQEAGAVGMPAGTFSSRRLGATVPATWRIVRASLKDTMVSGRGAPRRYGRQAPPLTSRPPTCSRASRATLRRRPRRARSRRQDGGCTLEITHISSRGAAADFVFPDIVSPGEMWGPGGHSMNAGGSRTPGDPGRPRGLEAVRDRPRRDLVTDGDGGRVMGRWLDMVH